MTQSKGKGPDLKGASVKDSDKGKVDDHEERESSPDADEEPGEERAAKGGLGDTLKRLFAVGTAAAFMTEESLRQSLGEMKLPANLIQTILSGASKSKEDLMGKVGTEITKLVSKIDLVKEASKFMETHKFKITAEIEVKRKDQT